MWATIINILLTVLMFFLKTKHTAETSNVPSGLRDRLRTKLRKYKDEIAVK